MMKKFIAAILSAAVLTVPVAVPVVADYTENIYDVERYNLTFDDGTVTNSIDGTPAKATTTTEVVMDASSDTSIFTKEFFWSFDFCFDTTAEGTTGNISIESKKNSGALNKQGPLLWINNGVLVTSTGSKATNIQNLGEISADTWYTAEIEGKMVVTGASATFRLYSYENGVKTLVQETSALNLRQFYGGATNGNPNCMKGTNVSFDNIKFISEFPDEIVISATEDATEMDAGTTLALDYIAKRLDKEVTKHAVTWSVWDESGENEITDESVTITTGGVLKADISSPAQVITVKATTDVGSVPLTGEYKVTVNAVNTSNEKFDTIVIDGPVEMKAGESATFTFTASKEEVDVTDTVTEEDVVWRIYDGEDLSPNNNKNISIENGVLNVDGSVIAQDIYVRAASVSGAIYTSKLVKINFSDKQVEKVVASNACETSIETADKVESIDGSNAYYINSATTIEFGDQGGYAVTELDIKFGKENAGLRLNRKDGSQNSSFLYRSDGTISQQTGGSSYKSVMSEVSTDKWYHMEILYKSDNASCNIYEYNEDGSLTLKKTGLDLNVRNGKSYGKLEIQSGTYVDNIKIMTPLPTDIEIVAPSQYMFTGETAQYSAIASRNNLPLKDFADFEWSVLDESKLPIIDDSITINAGLLSVSTLAKAQDVTVFVKASNGVSAEADMTIQVAEVFKFKNIGVNEEGTKIVKLYVDKNFVYDDEVTFILAIKDARGVLKDIELLKSFGDRYSLGENAITVDFELPADFDPDTYTIEAMVWTTL